MAKIRRSRSRRLVLDIGSHTIRLCELTPGKTGYQLTKYLQREVLKDPALDEEQYRGQRVQALKAILAEAKIRTKRAVFAVPGRSVFTRTRALPPVPEHKVTQIVRYEIQQQIPFSLDQISLDYQVVDRTATGGYEVLMLAIKVDVVEKELEILREAKRSVSTVDVCPLAAYNWMKYVGWGGEADDCVALLDMGASTTDIIIEREGRFRFTRPLNFGGNDITAAISREFALNFSDSERLKRQRGFAPTGDPQRDGKGGEVIGRVLGRLATEINRSFAYFRSQPGGGMVTRVVITGGASCLRNMAPYLQRELNLPVFMAQPLGNLEIGPGAQSVRQSPHQACVVLGLALRCVQSVPIEINLIPPRIIESARRKEQAFYWALVLATLALIMASIIPVRANENKNVARLIKVLEHQVQLYDPELVRNPTASSRFEGDMQKAKSDVMQRKTQVDQLDTAVKDRKFWLDALTKLNDARPLGAKIWFCSVQTVAIARQKKDAMAAATARPTSRGGGGMMGGLSLRGRKTDSAKGPKVAGLSDIGGAAAGLGGGPGLGGGTGGMAGRGSGVGGVGRAMVKGPGFMSEGFPGLAPAIEAAPSAGKGGAPMPGGSGGTPLRTTAVDLLNTSVESQPPQVPNGLRVQGYARDPDSLSEFIATLKKPDYYTADGVLYDEAWFQMVSAYEMDNAPAGQPGTTSQAGYDDASGYGETVISFLLEVQFPETIEASYTAAPPETTASSSDDSSGDEEDEGGGGRRGRRGGRR